MGTQVWPSRAAFLNPFTPEEPLFSGLEEPLLKPIHWAPMGKMRIGVLTDSLKDYLCHAAGFAKWCWPRNFAGTIKWWDNQPQLKEPPATYGGTLGFHGTLIENGCSMGLLQTKCRTFISDQYSWSVCEGYRRITTKPKKKNVIYWHLPVLRCGGCIHFPFFQTKNILDKDRKYLLILPEMLRPCHFHVSWTQSTSMFIQMIDFCHPRTGSVWLAGSPGLS